MLYKESKVLPNREYLKSLGFECNITDINKAYFYNINYAFCILYYNKLLSLYSNGMCVKGICIDDISSFISTFNELIDFFIEHFGLRHFMRILGFKPVEDDEYRKYTSEYFYIFNNHKVLERSPGGNIMYTDYIPIKGNWKILLDEICLIKK